jgi:hypothetical protein
VVKGKPMVRWQAMRGEEAFGEPREKRNSNKEKKELNEHN